MIIRTLGRFINTARFSNVNVNMFDGIKSDVAGMENISKLPFYLSFKSGVNLTLENKLEQANQHYQQSLNLLEDSKEQLKDHYMHIYKKLIMNNYALKKTKAVEENIYALIKTKKKFNIQSILLYDDYDSLFQLFLEFNPQKAILLGKALLSEKESENLTLKHKKLFQFNLANAYLLVGNYEDAKAKYAECLQSQPPTDMKIKLYNNLAIACWWNKNPLIAQKMVEPSEHKVNLIDSDFKQTKGLFLKGIEVSEDPDSLSDEQVKYTLKQAIFEHEFDLDAKFSKGQTCLLIYNLTQYYIHNEPTERVKILYWLRALLKLSKANNNPIFDEAYITLCLLNNDKQDLQAFIPEMLKKYQGKVQQIYFSKIASFLKRSQGKTTQSAQLSSKATELQSQFSSQDPYIFKRKFLRLYRFRV